MKDLIIIVLDDLENDDLYPNVKFECEIVGNKRIHDNFLKHIYNMHILSNNKQYGYINKNLSLKIMGHQALKFTYNRRRREGMDIHARVSNMWG